MGDDHAEGAPAGHLTAKDVKDAVSVRRPRPGECRGLAYGKVAAQVPSGDRTPGDVTKGFPHRTRTHTHRSTGRCMVTAQSGASCGGREATFR